MAGATIPRGRGETQSQLTLATYLAPIVRPLYDLVAGAVADALGTEVEVAQRADYSDLAAHRDDLAFVCGLPYVEVVDGMVAALTPIAAPVLDGSRYGGRAVYFSDVIVAASSPATCFADLRGARWAYNERGSHSGYLVVLHRLATSGEDSGFFRAWVDAGFHQRAIRLVGAGEVDATAVDSQVLAIALDEDPTLAKRIRVIDTLGPSTIQPLVAGERVSHATQRAIRDVVLALGAHPEERRVMSAMHVERFIAVEDADYDDIRGMLAKVEMAGLWSAPRPAGLQAIID
ncbi:MAG: PhnD/SsuA/transferrin family substrate-binding protein [Candidatus Dormibacteria bacterium]